MSGSQDELWQESHWGEVRRAQARPVARPNGRRWMVAGWGLLGIGATIAVVGALAFPAASITQADVLLGNETIVPVFSSYKWPVIWSGIATAQLGVALLLFGSLLRALFHLPGRLVTYGDLD